MLSLRNINPMVRAIGTMGAVTALVGGITFANLNSNTVALSPDNLTIASGALAIGAGSSCPTGNTTQTTGLQDGSLAPGGSTSVPFCLDNTGGVPLIVTVSIPQTDLATTAGDATTLTINCPTEGTLSTALNNWNGGYAFANPLPPNAGAGSIDDCTATATLSGSYSGTGGEVIPEFDIYFTGNQPS